MKYYKRSERCLKASAINKAIEEVCGTKAKTLEEYSRWKDLDNGSRIQVKFEIVRIKTDKVTGYYLKDSLGFVASETTTDLKDVKEWLKSHGFKTTHDWYIEDNGMSEETWNAWNQSNDF